MRAVIRAATAAAAGVALLTAIPASAPAAEQCVFGDLKASGKNRDEVERSLFCLTNLHRLRNGVAPLLIDTSLADAARAHSDDMIARGYFDHTNPDGAGPGARAAAFGYPFGTGENIATNNRGTALALFEQWRDSPPHNENMLSPLYPAAGIGISPRCCPGFGQARGVTGTQMLGVGPADTGDDGLDFYASSNRCAKAKESLFSKREARRRAKKRGAREKAKRLRGEIRELKRKIRRICEDPPGG